MKEYNFNTAYTQAQELYGTALNPDEFETLGMIAWDRIGNKKTRLYRYQTSPSQNSAGMYYLELPCNADILEAVTADYEDYQKTSNMKLAADQPNGWVESYIESRTFNTGSLYVPGKYIEYERVDNILYFKDRFSTINVVFKGVLVDADGLPSLNSKELDAVAAFCAYTDTYKKALVTRDANLMQFAKDLEAKWKNLCTQARVPEYLNQNEMDRILDVSTSWDRKRYGKSFKPIR